MAPVLSFTAEESWRILHPADASIFCSVWTDAIPAVPDADALAARWARILAVRAAVLKELETLRQEGRIGSSLQAEVEVTVPADDHAALAGLGDDLRFVFITSAATATPGAALGISAAASAHAKCDRCWHWRSDVGADAARPNLCGRCVSNLYGPGEARQHA